MQILDAAITGLWLLIGALIVTGGVHYESRALKFELSQVDAFAWALLVLTLARRGLPARVESVARRALIAFERRPAAWVTGACALYVGLQAWNSAWRFDSLHASAFDLGFVDQALWSTVHGELLHSSLSKGQSYLGEHFAPILAVFAQVYRLTDAVGAVFLLQACVLAAGAPLVYALARACGVSRGLSVLAALALLAYQPLRLANGFDFREDDAYVPILLGALVGLERRRWVAFWALVLLSWTVKESAPLYTGCLGAGLVLAGWARRRSGLLVPGLVLAALSVGAFALVNVVVTPHFAAASAGGKTMMAKRLGRFGSTNVEILRAMALHPIAFAAEALRPMLELKTVKYLLDVLTPFLAFVPSAWPAAGVVAFGLGLNLLVNQPTIGFHYECVLIPFLFWILARGLAARERRDGAARRPALAVALTIGFLLFYGRSPIESIRRNWPDAHAEIVTAELRRIDPQASVATQTALFPHVDHRRDAYLYVPHGSEPAGTSPHEADVVALDVTPGLDNYGALSPATLAATVDPARYVLAIDRDGLKIWRRKE